MTNRRIAAVWCRVSTHDQRELSLDSQDVAVKDVLQSQGFEVPTDYVLKVDWSSLDLMSCPEFLQLRRWIAEGKIQAVGTFDRDRLQAQGLQRLVFLSECQDNGVEVVTAQGPAMLEGGEGQLVELALALGKEKSVLRAQQGARDGLRDRARRKGLPPNMNKPYGMRWENNVLVPDENYPVVQDIWRMALRGATIMSIAAKLVERGIPTPAGLVDWSTSSVRHILKNRTYAGVIEALKTESVEPKVRKGTTYGKSGRRQRPKGERVLLQGLVSQPVVNEAELEGMQLRFEHNRHVQKNMKRRSYLLTGMVHCAECDRRYTGVTITRRGNEYSWYICANRWKRGQHGEGCKSHSLRAADLEDSAFDAVAGFLNGATGFENEVQRRSGLTASTEESLARELESIVKQQREEEDAEARAFRLAAHENITERVFSQEIGLIQTRRRWLAEQREHLEAQLADLRRNSFDPQDVEVLRERLETRLATASADDRRFVLEALSSKVIVQGDGNWELELQVPRSVPESDGALQVKNNRPGLKHTVNTESWL